MGVRYPSPSHGHGSGDPSPRKGSDSAPWNAQWPPETLPFRQMAGTQALLTLAQTLILALFVTESPIPQDMGVAFSAI